MRDKKRYIRHTQLAGSVNFTGKAPFDGTPRISREPEQSPEQHKWRAMAIARRIRSKLTRWPPAHGCTLELELKTDLRHSPVVEAHIFDHFKRSPYVSRFLLELKWVEESKSTWAYCTNLGSGDLPLSKYDRKRKLRLARECPGQSGVVRSVQA